jgi:predicted MFS family arabinose efflux permease
MTSSIARRELSLALVVLAGVQFTQVLDFMLLMPLGAQLMRLFDITPMQFGFFTALYTAGAAVSGFAGAFIIDRFDRKRALLALYAGFALTTLVCALAPGYGALLAARTLAGVFGGVLAANVYAIVGDVVPEGRRGRALAFVMAAPSIASVVGVPISLFLANHFTWRAPYLFLTALSSLILLCGWKFIPPLHAHVEAVRSQQLFAQARGVFAEPNHIRAFAFSGLLMITGFLLFPFVAPYLVVNVGVSESELPVVYFFGGLSAMAAVRLIGRLTDRDRKRRVFPAVAALSIVAAIVITHLPRLPLVAVVLISMFTWAVFPPRMVPAMALITSAVAPRLRGSFMSFNASIQQVCAGAAATVSSLIVGKAEDGSLTHFGTVGLLSALATIGCIALARRVKSVPQ